jgi:Fur family ferric uptake transcriptional regulator
MEHLLEEHGIKATPNRVLVARALSAAGRPLSLMELEQVLDTLDKSSIFRALTAFRDAHLVHVLEDSGDGVRYELCHSHSPHHDDDLHVHFYCTSCRRTFCLESTPVPPVEVPAGYESRSCSYLVKGLCPECAAKARN